MHDHAPILRRVLLVGDFLCKVFKGQIIFPRSFKRHALIWGNNCRRSRITHRLPCRKVRSFRREAFCWRYYSTRLINLQFRIKKGGAILSPFSRKLTARGMILFMEEVLSSQESSLSHFLSPLSFELFLSHSVAAVPVQQQQLEQPRSAAVAAAPREQGRAAACEFPSFDSWRDSG